MEAFDVLVTATFIAVVVAKVIERIRVRFPALDGDLVTLVAIVFGTAIAWGYGLDAAEALGLGGLAAPFGYLATGLFIAGEAGILADITGRSSTDKTTAPA